jgi:hypothetical protein
MSKARKLEVVAVVLAVLCLVCFLLSNRHYEFGLRLGRHHVGFAGGCFAIDRGSDSGVVAPFVYPGVKAVWSAKITGDPIFVPLWMPFIFFVTVAALAHRRARRPLPGTCGKCGYDLTGNTSGVCPECGTKAQ